MEAAWRRRSVRWEDEREVREPRPQRRQTRSVADARGESPSSKGASAHRRKRDGSLSAAATLSLYLSDALGDTGGRSPLRRRHNRSTAVDWEATQDRRVNGEDGRVASAMTEPLAQPSSPLSRFLQRRFQQEGRSVSRVAGASIPLKVLHHENPLRSRTLRSSGLSSGSMERLLREKISDARRIREQLISRTITTGLESQPPNLRQETRTIDAVYVPGGRSPTMGSPRLSVEVPVPHPKPQCPSLQVKPPRVPAVESPSRTSSVPPKDHATKQTDVTQTAARNIQRAWRQSTKRREQDGVDLAVETKASTGKSTEKESLAEPCTLHASITTNGTTDSGATEERLGSRDIAAETGMKTSSEAAIQTDSADCHEREFLEHNAEYFNTSTDPSGKAVAWQDDELSFLEDGRYATNVLLDSSAHKEDTSIEALVWKKPHVAVELQEAKRRERERARRAVVQTHQKKKTIQKEEPAPPLGPTDTSAKGGNHIRVMLRQRKRRPLRLAMPRTGRSVHQREMETPAGETDGAPLITQEDGSIPEPLTITSEPQPSDRPNDGAFAAMLAQLHQYVVFSDMVLVADGSHDAAVRNDLIRVESWMSIASSWADRESTSGVEENADSLTSVLSEGNAPVETERNETVRTIHADTAAFLSEVPQFFVTDDSPQDNSTVALQQDEQESQPQYSPLPPLALAMADLSDVATKQREFREALDAFQQSLRASHSERLSTPPDLTPSDQEDDTDGAVDAELEAMLREIQRCKEQIASARRQAS